MNTKIQICSVFTSESTGFISFIRVLSASKLVIVFARASQAAVSGKPSQPSDDPEDSDKSIDPRSGKADSS